MTTHETHWDPAIRALVERAKAEERERIAQAIEAESERRHAAFAASEDEILAEMRAEGHTWATAHHHWNRHDDGCGMCGLAGAADIARADSLAAQPAPEAATVEEGSDG